MPGARNQRGGKGYKKGKKRPAAGSTLDFPLGKFAKAEDGWQDYGRVLRMLGDRRVLCFCNDGNERITRIRGGLCKGPGKKIIEVGDIVLLSFRDFEDRAYVTGTSMEGLGVAAAEDAPATASALTVGSGRKEVADLIDKYDRGHWHEIRRQPNTHPRLFRGVEQGDDTVQHTVDDLFDDGAPATMKEAEDSDVDVSDSDAEVDVDAI
jgi:initiation factor 1A